MADDGRGRSAFAGESASQAGGSFAVILAEQHPTEAGLVRPFARFG